MAYQALYRRYRSRRFSDVVGQPQVTTALLNAVREDRVGHAYLFSGPRGTGKTSTARILAKALNCTDLRDGEPCCECDSCLAIEAGTSYDLQELDAASNNGVEKVRDLIERVALGSPGRTKVYILDEVHMLSTGASNALLKTLEEPPPHVVFVLATTDPHKVLATIRSRTQHFEFHLIPADELEQHVRFVIADAGLDVGDDAVEHVLRQGGGSARDTLSALDQVAAAGGISAGDEHAGVLVDALCRSDTGAALQAVADAVASGRDPRTLGEELLGNLRDVFLHRMGSPLPQSTEADRARTVAWAEHLTDRATTLALEEVGSALLEMRQAPDPRIPLEVALVKLTRAETGDDLTSLLVRLERLEQAVASGAVPAPAVPAAPAPTAAAPAPAPAPAPASAPPAAPAAAPAPAATAPSPARSSGRPADAARAALAKAGASSPSPSPARTEAPAAPAAPPPVPPRPTRAGAPAPRPEPAPQEAAAPAPATPPVDEAGPPAEANRPTAAPAAAGGLPDRDALTMGWADAVLPKLRGLTKAMYSGGRFVSVQDGVAQFAVDNDVYRERCDQKRPEVEAALAAHFGVPIRLQVVIEKGGAGAAGPSSPATTGRTAPAASAPEPDDEYIDVAGLEDAPADPRSGVDRITEAFPGAQLIEED